MPSHGTIGTVFSQNACRVLLLGSGELGKEVAIELKRLGCEVIACDRYANAPAMQVADRSHVFSMLDAATLRRVVEEEKPQYIVPEIEAIATEELVQLEQEGYTVVPNARAARLTMNREGIRRFVAEELQIPTSPYVFVDSKEAFEQACKETGFPLLIKPAMSSSGKGQSLLKKADAIDQAWTYAQEGGRVGGTHHSTCIVEGFVDFDYEITVLTVRASNGTFCCDPIGHVQEDGDYRRSWQPMAMSEKAWAQAQEISRTVVDGLGGYGLFGVELFVCGDEIIFSEVSPRPHDTGMVTLATQELSEFALHARAFLGLPIPDIFRYSDGASVALLANGEGAPSFNNCDTALSQPGSQLRLFGKHLCGGQRRLGVALARGTTTDQALDIAQKVADSIHIETPTEL